MNGDPVTDAGGPHHSSHGVDDPGADFQFDLGSALARLGLDAPTAEGYVDVVGPTGRADPDDDPLPRRNPPSGGTGASGALPLQEPATTQPPAPPPLPIRQTAAEPTRSEPIEPEPLPVRRPAADPVAPHPEPLPTRTVAEPPNPPLVAPMSAQPPQSSPPEVVASRRSSQRRSVFDEKAAAPTLPTAGTLTPTPPPVVAATQAPALSPDPSVGAIPTLPPSNPVAPPSVAPPIESGPSTPDIHAMRAAQARASRNDRQGKLFGRTLLSFLLIGALIAVALVFGRAYLFPAEWDPSLTPIVDEIQQSRGVDFDETVVLVAQPPTDYAQTVLESTVGTSWVDRLPEWRALGIAGGTVSLDTVADQVARMRLAVYDAGDDTIYQSDRTDPAVAAADLRFALESAFARQAGGSGSADVEDGTPRGFVGVSSLRELVRQAADRAVVGATAVVADAGAGAEGTAGEAPGRASDGLGSLPLPIAYELWAVRSIGEPLLGAVRVDPVSLQLGDQYPDAIYSLLDDRPVNAPTGLLRPGERGLADPVSLGTDDWSLVWGTRLPSSTVDQLTSVVTADSYRPIDRDGTTCVVAVFQTGSDSDAAVVLEAMATWATRAPAEATALATQIDAARVQLETCDPGDAAIAPDLTSVDALIARQIGRLSS